MNRELFGTDGVRGLAGQYPLDEAGAHRIGMAIGTHFAQVGQDIIIACDPRESSAQLLAALTEGLNAVGVNVTSVGVIPTPGLAYLTRQGDDFVAGVMITASHNPYQYNGVKVFDGTGDKLSDKTEALLNGLIENGTPPRGNGRSGSDNTLAQNYEDFLVASANGFQLNTKHLAIDSANGAASGLAERVFKRLAAKVTSLFDQPDGRNINDGCGATDTAVLQEEVISKHLDLGIALDGDSDRLIMIDELGREVKGDYILYILAVSGNLSGVVATVMSNLGFDLALRKRGISLERTRVGDRYVLEGLEKTGFKLGGEQSGHIILPDLLKTGDALLAAVQMVQAVANSSKSLAQWCDEVELVPQALVNIPLTDKSSLDRPEIQSFLNNQIEQLGSSGRLLIRPSGTEPLARVMVEAPDAQAIADKIASELQTLLAEQLPNKKSDI